MGFGLIMAGAAAAGLIYGATKKAKNTGGSELPSIESFDQDDELFNVPIEVPVGDDTGDIKVPKGYVGKYNYSVEVYRNNLTGFNAASYVSLMKEAVKKGDYVKLKSLSQGLNKDKIREIHNSFLESTNGSITAYQFFQNSSKLPYQVKLAIISLLTSAGVGKKIVKNR